MLWWTFRKLRSYSVYKREEAVAELVQLGSSAVRPLIRQLAKRRRRESWWRPSAIEALSRIGDRAAVPTLIVALGDDDPTTAGYAARALGNLGASEAIKPLIETLRNKSWSVVCDSVTALGDLQASEAVPSLIQILRNGISKTMTEIYAGGNDPVYETPRSGDGGTRQNWGQASRRGLSCHTKEWRQASEREQGT